MCCLWCDFQALCPSCAAPELSFLLQDGCTAWTEIKIFKRKLKYKQTHINMAHCISLEKAGMAKGPALKHCCGDTALCSSAPYLCLWQHTAFIKFYPFLASHWPNQHNFFKIRIYIFPLAHQDGLLVRAKPKLERKRGGNSQGPVGRKTSPAHGEGSTKLLRLWSTLSIFWHLLHYQNRFFFLIMQITQELSSS